jgi:predicted nucleic acid-binding Zn finger protein
MVNRKSNNKQFEVHGEYLHIYDTLTEIVNNEQTEYEGELYVVQTDLAYSVIESNYQTMLSFLQKIREQGKVCLHTKDLAQAYLDATDYISNKCYELGLVVADRYPNEFALRNIARQIVREGWK